MFGVTLRTNFNDLRPSYNDNARPTISTAAAGCHFAAFGGGESVNAVEIQCRTCNPQIQAKGDTLYVTADR